MPLLILLGTAAFSGLALLMAGTLRAEATLAAANLVYILLLGVGGVVFPLTKFPAAARPVLELLPTGALSTGLRDVLQHGTAFPVGNTSPWRSGPWWRSPLPRACSGGSRPAPTDTRPPSRGSPPRLPRWPSPPSPGSHCRPP